MRLSRALALLCLLWPAPAFAGLVTYDLTGTLGIHITTTVSTETPPAVLFDTQSDLDFWLPGLTIGDVAYTGIGTYDTESNVTSAQINLAGHVFSGIGAGNLAFIDLGPAILTPVPGAYNFDDFVLNLTTHFITLDGAFFGPGRTVNYAWTGDVTGTKQVPEPATVSLLLVGLVSLLHRRRQRVPSNGGV